MISRNYITRITVILMGLLFFDVCANEPPKFVHDMNNVQISEHTQPGTIVYKLLAEDVESEVYYSINGTDAFVVDSRTGVVKLARLLNKKVEPEISFTVTCEDVPAGHETKNIVSKLVIVHVVDKPNGNPPSFDPLSPVELYLAKDSPSGTVISTYNASDLDLIGQPLTFQCGKFQGRPSPFDVCKLFTFVYKKQNSSFVQADLVLLKPLTNVVETDVNFILFVTDGIYSSNITVRISLIENGVDKFLTVSTFELPPFITEPFETTVVEYDDVETTKFTTLPRVTSIQQKSTWNSAIGRNNASETKSATPTDAAVTILPNETTKIIEFTITAQQYAIKFEPSEIALNVVENWPVSFPLPFKPRLRINYDFSNPVILTLKIIEPESLKLDNASFSLEPSTLYYDRNFDVILQNSDAIDKESVDRIKLLVEAIDEIDGSKGELKVTLNIVDVNDNSPNFAQNDYSFMLDDNAESGKFIGNISATDLDSDLFGTEGVVFHLIGPWAKYFGLRQAEQQGTVEIFAHPCDLHVSPSCLPYKRMPDQVVLVIRATDTNGTGLFTDVPLTMNITRVNVAKPKFVRDFYYSKLNEKNTQFDPVLILQATDDDTDRLIYGIEDPTHLFGADNETGLIFVAKPELVTVRNLGVRFNLTGTVSDGKNGLVKTKITIEIVPGFWNSMENKPPVFTASYYTATVPPNAPDGYVILNVIANDPEHQSVQYYLTSGGAGYFSVKRDTGEVLYTGAKFKNNRNFTLNILAVDSGSPQGYSTTVVSILCLGLKSVSPKFEKATFVTSLFENATVGTYVEIPQVVDEDAYDGYTVKILSVEAFNEEGRPWLFEDLTTLFAYEDDALILKAPIMNKGIFSIHVHISASDITHPLEDAAKAFVIVNVVQTVKIQTELFNLLGIGADETLNINISSDTPVNAFVYHFRVLDKHPGSIVFNLKNDSVFFWLDEKSGLLLLRKSLAKTKFDSFRLEIEAKNLRNKLMTFANLIVNVVEKQKVVKLALDRENYSANVVENVPIGSFVFRFMVTAWFCSSYNFNLTGSDANSFYVDDQGRILTASKIDREQRQSYGFTIEVSCRTFLNDSNTLVIPVKAPAIVNVLDLNDNSPTFEQQSYFAIVQQNANVDSYVTSIKAKDPDAGINGSIAYSFNSMPEEIEDKFFIDAMSGEIKTAKLLTGLMGNYKVMAQATDGGNLNTTVAIFLTIQSSNKCMPKFIVPNVTNLIMTVSENVNAGYLLAKVKAVTEDPKCVLKYTFKDQSTGQSVGFTNEFQINSENGELTTRKSLDREQQANYELILSASDSRTNETIPAQIMVEVVILDENDNIPTFQPPAAFSGENCSAEMNALKCWFSQDVLSYNFSVYENEPIGIVIGKLLATDPDEGENGTVFYHLLTNQDSSKVSVDMKTGVLKTKVVYDREKQDTIKVFVVATNSKTEPTINEQKDLLARSIPWKNLAQIMITVLDRNDHGPSFDKLLYFGAISFDSAPETLVLRIRAVDPDISGGGVYYKLKKTEYHYKKSNVEEKRQFSVDNVSGEIRTKATLKDFSQGYFQLFVDSFNDENQTDLNSNFNLTDSTVVKIWIFEPEQLVRIVVKESPVNITDQADSIAKLKNLFELNTQVKFSFHKFRNFGDSLGANVVLQQIEYNKDKTGSITSDKVDLLAVFIDRSTQEIMSTERVLNLVDKAGIRAIAVDPTELSVIEILPARLNKNSKSASLSGAAIALIVFGCILFFGLLAFLLLLCYLKYSFIQELKVFKNVEPPTPIKITPSMFFSSKENPLWNEVEKKPYEEQELSMPPMPNDEITFTKPITEEGINPNPINVNIAPDVVVDANTTYAKIHKPLSSRVSQASSLTDYDGANLYQSLRK